MKIRDIWGHALNEGDPVVFSINDNVARGNVAKIGLIDNPNPNQPQLVLIAFTLPMQILQNGIVPGIAKAAPDEVQVQL